MPERARRPRTPLLTPQTEKGEWLLVDADGVVLGRLASRLARVLMGKHKPTWTPHVACGDYAVVVNAEKVRVTGKAALQKPFYNSKFMPGHLRAEPLESMLKRRPDEAVRRVLKRMLPKNTLGTRMIERVKIYAGPDHPHASQRPRTVALS